MPESEPTRTKTTRAQRVVQHSLATGKTILCEFSEELYRDLVLAGCIWYPEGMLRGNDGWSVQLRGAPEDACPFKRTNSALEAGDIEMARAYANTVPHQCAMLGPMQCTGCFAERVVNEHLAPMRREANIRQRRERIAEFELKLKDETDWVRKGRLKRKLDRHVLVLHRMVGDGGE